MTANEAMLVLAEKIAGEYGYIDTGKFTIDATKDSFWGNRSLGVIAKYEGKPKIVVNACRYIKPVFDFEQEERKRVQRIEIDMHFGKPRLHVHLPDGTFACLTYEDGHFTEGQAWEENGPALLSSLKAEIDSMITA